MAKSGAERKRGLKILKNLGSFQHNIDVLKKGRGKLIVVRRTNGKRSAHSYLPCSRCYGFFYKCDLYRHSCPCPPLLLSMSSPPLLLSMSSPPLLLSMSSPNGVKQATRNY